MTSAATTRSLPTWARAFRRDVALTSRERLEVSAWLELHGWRYSGELRGWLDPLDGDDWSIEGALRLQYRYEAAHVLVPLGWELIGVPKWATKARPVTSRGRPSHAVAVLTALRRLGVGAYPPPREPTLSLPRPRLLLVRGGAR